MKNYKLLTPGPLTTTETVKKEMMFDHCTWDDDYKKITLSIIDDLLELAHVDKEKYTAESKITIDMSILNEVIKRANIKFVPAGDSREAYKVYFEKIEKTNSKAIGGKIPDEKIFMSK